MSAIVVTGIRRFETDGRSVVSAALEVGGRRQEVWYRISPGPVAEGADAWLAAALVPAMKHGGPLRIDGVVSSKLLDAVPTIQEIFCAWSHDFQRIPIDTGVRPRPPAGSPRGVGCFFSGGVDSFYSFLKHREEITALIFVHGFDIKLARSALRERVSRVITEVAAELGKPLIEVETNLRDFSDRDALWGQDYYGSALASVALLLSPRLRTVYVPASHSYRDLLPRGSHPMLDPLWSTEATQIMHDGCEAGRVEKVARVATCDQAMKALRVCWENRDEAYNCGRCEKCLRTMVSLHVVGAFARCRTFPRPLELWRVARIRTTDAVVRGYVEENLRAIERAQAHSLLADALRDALAGVGSGGLWGWLRRLVKQVRYRLAAPMAS